MNYEELHKISKGKAGGWLSNRDSRFLTRFLSDLKYDYPPVIAEIGVFQGGSSLIFLIAQPTCKFYAIDNFLGGPHSPQFQNLRDGFNKTTEDYKDRITVCVGDSKAIGRSWRVYMDILFIDGCHDGDYPSADIANFTPYLKKDGYLMIDDYGMPNVEKHVESLLFNSDYKLIAQAPETEDIIVFQRK